MSSTSGISLHADLQHEIASTSDDIRFRKIIIQNDVIVQEQSINSQSTFLDDLNILQDILKDNEPAYILAKQDQSSQWLLITYVPDAAKVREKMLYASSRPALTKALTSLDTLSVSSKSELTPSAYLAHLSQREAPPLISSREKEIAEAQAAERADAVSGTVTSRSRSSHLGNAGFGLEWTEEAIQAVEAFRKSDVNNPLVMLKIDVDSEILALLHQGSCDPEDVSSKLPAGTPVYALYAFKLSPNSDFSTFFIYSCPTSSPVKQKMLYSSASRVVQNKIKELGVEVLRKLETSDPREVTATWMKDELRSDETSTSDGRANNSIASDTQRPFAKPKGPPRKAR